MHAKRPMKQLSNWSVEALSPRPSALVGAAVLHHQRWLGPNLKNQRHVTNLLNGYDRTACHQSAELVELARDLLF